jgi:imidazolonepropionase-like amidohydrolase
MARTVFSGGRVFDGSATLVAADIAVDGGRVVDVGPGLDGDVAIDLAGAAVLPGLFDCHTHVMISPARLDTNREMETPFSYWFYTAIANLRRTLDIGITTVRDAGYADLGLKTAVADGLIAGPRLHIAISILSQTGGHADGWLPSGYDATSPTWPGHPSGIVDGPDEMRRRVRELIRAGADQIKVCTSGGVMSPRDDPRHGHFRAAELDVLVEEASAAEIPVMAHAQGAPGIKAAVRAGIRSIEHGIFLDDEAIDLMLERGTWLVPTLMAPQGVLDAAARGIQIPPASLRKAREVTDIHREAVAKAIGAGVKVAMGTDSGITEHGQNLRELDLMVKAGMSPVGAMLATSRSAAELLGVADDRGSIDAGKRADLTIVTGDPFDYGDLAERVQAVFQDGRLVAGALP